jgi:protein-S-isoprenylcysteine O-methyltransferase
VTLQQILIGIGVVYGGSEVVLALALRSRRNLARGADRGSLALLWTILTLAVVISLRVLGQGAARLPGPVLHWAAAGVAVLVAGLAVRWTAILTLRRAFTVDVAIAEDQRVVRHGIYGVIRHPGYAGNLLAFLGMAIAYGDWLAGLVLFLPIAAAFAYRIRVEERALRAAFGEEYDRYARRTRRLIPFVL